MKNSRLYKRLAGITVDGLGGDKLFEAIVQESDNKYLRLRVRELLANEKISEHQLQLALGLLLVFYSREFLPK